MCTKDKEVHQHTIKSLINDHSAVYDSLLGNASVNKQLVVLNNHCIIVRRDHKSMKGKVKLIGGGGAGIEPADSSYIGKGMLTAAVVGRIFTAPSANEILVAIRELALDHSDGILLLVKNYVGDKLNFRLAMEQAWCESISVKMLVIGDDIFHHIPARHGRKGAAGIILVYKIIGEMAEQGKTLEEIVDEYNSDVADNLATMGVTLTPCPHISCPYFNNFIGPQEMVLGMGIYGKGGTKKIKITELTDVVSLMLEEIISYLKCESYDSEIVVLVNNLGATIKLEEAVIAQEVYAQLNKLSFKVCQFYVGTFMTSLGTQGFSISVLIINSQDILMYLNSPTSALGWPITNMENITQFDSLTFFLPPTLELSCSHDLLRDSKLENLSTGPILSEKATAAVKQIVMFAVEAIISCESQLNIIDKESGDGDTGSVLKRAAEVVRSIVIDDEMDFKNPAKFLFQLSELCCEHMAGLSGALYSVFFKNAAKTFENSTEITIEVCCAAFRDAVKALKCYGNVELGDRTVYDALGPAFDSFEAAVEHGKSMTHAVYLAATTCEFKAEESRQLLPSTLQHMTLQQPIMYADAGAHAATIWLRALTFDTEIPCLGPGIFLWRFLTEEESTYLAEHEMSVDDLMFFFENKIGSEGYLLISLLIEAVKYCKKRFVNDPRKISSLVGTVYYTHLYFVGSRWRTPAEVYFYFRESILRQAVESPPVSIEIFQAEEAKDCVIFFTETYVRNLPIISILHLPHYKLRLKLNKDKAIGEQLPRERIIST